MPIQVNIGDIPDAFRELLLKGDDRCLFKKGARINKILGEIGDEVPVGSPGTILGNHHTDIIGDIYLVKYDCFPFELTTRGCRIAEL